MSHPVISRVLTAVTLTSLLVPGRGLAQAQTAAPAPGSRVRVFGPATAGWITLTGTLVRLSADSVWLHPDSQESARGIPRVNRTTLDVSRGTGSRVVAGTLFGLAVGAALTTYFLVAFCGGDNLCNGDEQVRAIVLLGLPPVAVGAGIGALVRYERWEHVPLERLAEARRSGPGRWMVGVAVPR